MGSTTLGMDGDPRYDFGPSLRIVYRCSMCSGTVLLNRGCQRCEQHFCKVCYAKHDAANNCSRVALASQIAVGDKIKIRRPGGSTHGKIGYVSSINFATKTCRIESRDINPTFDFNFDAVEKLRKEEEAASQDWAEVVVNIEPGALGIVHQGSQVLSVKYGSQAERLGIGRGWRIRAVNESRCDSFDDRVYVDARLRNMPFQLTLDRPSASSYMVTAASLTNSSHNEENDSIVDPDPDHHYCSWCGKEYRLPQPRLGMCCGRLVKEGRLSQANRTREKVRVVDLQGLRFDRGQNVVQISPAHATELSLKLQDRIVEINGKPVQEYYRFLMECEAVKREPVIFTVVRRLNSRPAIAPSASGNECNGHCCITCEVEHESKSCLTPMDLVALIEKASASDIAIHLSRVSANCLDKLAVALEAEDSPCLTQCA